jgi:lipopolysaccharide/colanic/teichoic acid biosynthesis glycosyltransferase
VISRFRYVAFKRAFDLVLVLLLTPLALLLGVVCALLIRLDSPGPIFFTQLRTGKDGRRFRMLKFRTMVVDAEERKEALRHLSIVAPPDFKIIHDPRITRVGRLLRKTSLDELPQIVNVLRGDMSLVGPRPTFFAASRYDLWQTERLEARPGITGLWQVYGRYGRDGNSWDERVRLDVRYVRGMCLKLDLAILARTLIVVLTRPGV